MVSSATENVDYEASSIDVPDPSTELKEISKEQRIEDADKLRKISESYNEINLHVSSMESFYIMNELAIGYYAGDMQKCYLRFDKQGNKLLDVIYDVKKGGKIEINPRYDEHRDELWLIESKLGLKIYNEMARNRSAGKGTVLNIIGNEKDRMISEIKCEAVNVVNL